MADTFDIAIFGSGFGGSLLALIARRLGLSALLVERGRHPRFAIGESTSPLTNLLLEDLAHRYDLPQLLPVTSFGPWQRAYPEITCGLKRGFTFYGQKAGAHYQAAPERTNQLLVAASPNNEVADTHWLRADVDAFFVGEAVRSGVAYCDQSAASCPQRKDGLWQFTVQGRPLSARFLVDATGPRGFLSREFDIGEGAFAEYPATQALYTHFAGVRRCNALPDYAAPGVPPYSPDDAALHHVFDGGWIWVLHFGNGMTSAGVAVTDALAESLGLADGAAAWQRLLARFPSVAAQFANAQAVQPFIHAPRLAYRAAQAAGPGWAQLPSAAAFVDPLFSTGFPLTLLGIERLAALLEDWGKPEMNARLAAYAGDTLADADATADLVGACYAVMGDFPKFTALSMLYFAAASYSEVARRLGQPHLAGGFLGRSHPTFGPALRRMTARARSGDNFAADIPAAIDCLNIAGLCDPRKNNWYGVDLGDIVRGAAKLGLTPEAMQAILRDAPWAQAAALSAS